MNNLKIIQLPVDRWEKYKNLRLEALKTEPQAFSSSYEEELQRSEEEWKNRVENFSKGDNSYGIFAEDNGELVGMMNARLEDMPKMQHVAYIHGVYVKPEYRGKGVGKILLQAIMDWIATRSEIVKINLDVTTTQDSAIALYKSFGFQKVGELKKEYFINGKFYDVYEMEKYLK